MFVTQAGGTRTHFRRRRRRRRRHFRRQVSPTSAHFGERALELRAKQTERWEEEEEEEEEESQQNSSPSHSSLARARSIQFCTPWSIIGP